MRIVCFGDSLTSCGGPNGRYSDILAERFRDHTFINRGVAGDTLIDARQRLDADVLHTPPDIVLLEFGANDWWAAQRPPAAWTVDLEFIVQCLHRAGIHVVILGVFGDGMTDEGALIKTDVDARAHHFRQEEARIARAYHCDYIANIQAHILDKRYCWSDTNHPNDYGNRFVADTIEPYLQPRLGTPPLGGRRPTIATLNDLWNEAVRRGPTRTAAVDRRRRLSYQDAERHVRHLARHLASTVRCHRPTIAAPLPNCLEFYLLYWAVMRLGGIIVPLNPALRHTTLEAVLTHIQPNLIVVKSSRDSTVYGKAISAMSVDDISEMLDGSTPIASGTADQPFGCQPNDPAIIMHTSGTTGTPKGAVMRHCDVMVNLHATIAAHQFTPDDQHLLINPMFHATALYSTLPAAAYQQATVVIHTDTRPDELMTCIQTERITTMMTVPTVLQRLVASPAVDKHDPSTLRVIGYAGSAMPPDTVRQLRVLFPRARLHHFFGLTETICATHLLSNADIDRYPTAIGRPLPFVDTIVVDEQNRPTVIGQSGQLLIGRDSVISHYFNAPHQLATSLLTIDGKMWFRTGDRAVVNDEGIHFITGRTKDMIIVGGENVYAGEVEAVLLMADHVIEAAVIGIAATGIRAALGELIRAYVVTEPEIDVREPDLRRHCHAHLASYQIPHEIVFRSTLPRNATGKVDKTRLTSPPTI